MLETLQAFLEPPLVYVLLFSLLILIALLMILSRYLARRYVILHRSAGTDQIAFELARIANSLEILVAAPPRHRQTFQLPESARPHRERVPVRDQRSGVGLSMFGR